VLFGGYGGFAGELDDAYELGETDWRIVPQQNVPPPQDGHRLVSAIDGGVVMLGGRQGYTTLGEPVRLRWDSTTGTNEACTAADTDGDALAACADPDCALYCDGCGDGTCDPFLESCGLCPMDCGTCAQ